MALKAVGSIRRGQNKKLAEKLAERHNKKILKIFGLPMIDEKEEDKTDEKNSSDS